jgi:uncharacterized membrane protein YphA (DoxX/SURF4 family)
MERISANGIWLARVLIAMVFILNAIGVIDQTIPAREMAERGLPAAIVPLSMLVGRTLEFIAGVALILGVFPRFAALAYWRSSFPQRWFHTLSGCRPALCQHQLKRRPFAAA